MVGGSAFDISTLLGIPSAVGFCFFAFMLCYFFAFLFLRKFAYFVENNNASFVLISTLVVNSNSNIPSNGLVSVLKINPTSP